MDKGMMKGKGMMTPEEMKQVDMMMESMAYMDKKHPDHAATVAKVNEAYRKGYKKGKR